VQILDNSKRAAAPSSFKQQLFFKGLFMALDNIKNIWGADGFEYLSYNPLCCFRISWFYYL
jgi:hypothetical protein